MAISGFSNPSLNLSLPLFSSLQTKPSKFIKSPFLPVSLKPRFPTLSSSSPPLFPSLKSSLQYLSKALDGEEYAEISKHGGEDKLNKSPQTMKELIRTYRQAVLDGDENTVSVIEAMICVLENERNVLVQKSTEISTDLSSEKDKLLRLKADFDNFRKRSEKNSLTLTADVQAEVIENLLSIVDNFERAKQHFRPETDKETKINTSYQGIYKQFVEIMRSLRVAVIETVGKPFDPSLHEAVGREESLTFSEGIIIQEVRRGFVLGDRLLRPALVKVSSGRKKSPSIANKPCKKPATAARADESGASNL